MRKEIDLTAAACCPYCMGHNLVVGVRICGEERDYCISCADCGTTGPVQPNEESALEGWQMLCGVPE